MYISIEQSQELDRIVKSTEVALRSFVSDTLIKNYSDATSFKLALKSISISDKLIYSKRFDAKLKNFTSKHKEIFQLICDCKTALDSQSYNNDVPYISEIIDLLLIFFNAHFSDKDIVKEFSSIEEFHYCCTLYHKLRNNLSHPASHPTTTLDANKVVYFIENLLAALDQKYFWYATRENIGNNIQRYNGITLGTLPRHHNLNFASSTHKRLLCRETIIKNMYESLLGDDIRQRLAGSIVLYGYGGVGKTAITTEFLYRLLRDKRDGKHPDIEYLLFFSSKDEYLKENKTTGELYIDTAKPEFSTLADLKTLICKCLGVHDISSISDYPGRGIIAIDNIENIDGDEKLKILDFIKSLPRTVQFIVTSRGEEACEEKIHIEEFSNNDTGVKFVEEIIESEGFNLEVSKSTAEQVINATKGNALIIVQTLNIIDRGVSTFDEITRSLESMRSKNSEMIANFMYKNTFDDALKHLSSKGYPVNEIMQVISLYDERIELYSISKLAKLEIADAERICNYLLERLVLKKSGEYYELNEFAKRFVFIKLLPDRIELNKVRDKIKKHKERMKLKLAELENTLNANSALHRNVNEWQPKNYIDKIVIAELFSLYGDAIKCVGRNDKRAYEKYLKEFDEHSFITNHPYVPLQKARLLKEGMFKFHRGDNGILQEVERLYEEAVESIEYDYRYLIGSIAHASLLMLFGIFLCQHLKEHSRAIRFLEDAKKFHGGNKGKGWFIVCNYLSSSYEKMYSQTKDNAYKDLLRKLVKEVLSLGGSGSSGSFSIETYKKKYSLWLG